MPAQGLLHARVHGASPLLRNGADGGLGPVVFQVDIPQMELGQFEYQNEWRAEHVRFYALPLSMLERFPPTKTTFQSITGRPWNAFVVVAYDKVPRQRRVSQWSVVWQSRRGVAHPRVKEQTPTLMTIEIQTTTDFDPEKDYIVVETHEVQNRTIGNPVKETWKQDVIAGIEPEWALFPKKWKNWVFNEKVKKSAIDFILSNCPGAKQFVDFALGLNSKENEFRAWERVMREIERAVQQRFGVDVNLGKLPGQSYTAVKAMPHRIASRLAQHLPYGGWEPPVPQPAYASPDISGRIVVANPVGVYPTSGPGVDHRLADRSRDGNEGKF